MLVNMMYSVCRCKWFRMWLRTSTGVQVSRSASTTKTVCCTRRTGGKMNWLTGPRHWAATESWRTTEDWSVDLGHHCCLLKIQYVRWQEGWPNAGSLTSHFLLHSCVSVQKLHVFLFQDVLVITRSLALNDQPVSYQLCRQPIPIRLLDLEDLSDGEMRVGGSIRGAFSNTERS